MKATFIAPIASLRGKITKGYYARVLNGQQIIQRCPVRRKAASSAQLAARKRFAETYAVARQAKNIPRTSKVVTE